MLKKLKIELKENQKYLSFSIIISILSVAPQFLEKTTTMHYISLVLVILLLILLSKISKILFLFGVVYLNITSVYVAHIALHWGGSPLERMGVVLQSPRYERIEYMRQYISIGDFLVIFNMIFLIGLTIFIIKQNRPRYKIIKLFSIIVASLLFILLMNKEPLKFSTEYFKSKKRSDLILERRDYLKSNMLNNKNNLSNTIYDKVIIIQGESVNKHHMGIYGYNKATTPFLTSMTQKGLLYKFNAISPANQTKYCIPMFYTNASVKNWKNGFITSSVIKDFENNKYQTYWISNQGKIGIDDDYIAEVASDANSTIFFNQGDFTTAKTDITIKEYLDKKISNNDKEMYIFHLIGSHHKYTSRYNSEHILYQNPKNIIQEYDNSIYFTDYIIKNIFKYFDNKNQKILIVYLSDHGERVKIHGKCGHGFIPPSKEELEIPLVIYSSIPNSRIDLLYKKNKDCYFNLENFNSLVSYITNIKDESNISYSPIIFSSSPKHKFDYNKLKVIK
jgi:heptose-I-phosphate ethanolaminephosphotransferase